MKKFAILAIALLVSAANAYGDYYYNASYYCPDGGFLEGNRCRVVTQYGGGD